MATTMLNFEAYKKRKLEEIEAVRKLMKDDVNRACDEEENKFNSQMDPILQRLKADVKMARDLASRMESMNHVADRLEATGTDAEMCYLAPVSVQS
jgi:chlorite dismutase